MSNFKRILFLGMLLLLSMNVMGEIAATHIYHNHMPNFWPYYDVTQYEGTGVGEPIRYAYDGQVINLKNSPPSNYTYFLPNGSPMPHDDLVSYYAHHAKTGAYLSWPMDTAKGNHGRFPRSQTHVTMSAAVMTNVNSFAELGNLDGYGNKDWGGYWRDVHYGTRTTSGAPALDLIHFTGHHTMGPLTGNAMFKKDLVYHNVTVAQDWFLGSNFKSSKGFFPTELGFSERLIPVLEELGVEWSVLGNVHYSRTLKDYPYLNDPGVDCVISPPNRADMQNTDPYGGAWVSRNMFNEKQVTQNKFPFASIPHWVQYVDPDSGKVSKVAGIPVEQAGSWEEGYQGSVTGGFLKEFEGNTNGRTQYFTIAHDGDNSQGRAGDGGTWAASGNTTYSEGGVDGVGVDEYLKAYPIPEDDVVHVQDGSWIDTRDSSSDPQWHHWKLPPCIWKGQFGAMNDANGTTYAPKNNFAGVPEGMTVSFEYGYHYLERNFALLQAAENYALTAEQIWLEEHPNHWKPSSDLDHELIGNMKGNQLNPYMYSYPVKGDPNSDYAGGANPAELAWYFLIASIDSGFGYYDENQDDGVKPTVSFNQSLHFSQPYVDANLSKDKTGPSVWWPQRWPYNPGSANTDKSEGWTLHYFDTNFGIYTYAYDVNEIADIKVKVREHKYAWTEIDAKDKTYKLYDPSAHSSDPAVDPSRVGEWVTYDMNHRDLTKDINGVAWQVSSTEIFEIVPAKEIGDLYYTYIGPEHGNGDYRDVILDYYIEATDGKGNVTKSVIQQVYVGQGKFTQGDKIVEDANGSMEGTYPFVTDKAPRPPKRAIKLYVESSEGASVVAQVKPQDESWSSNKTMTGLDADPKYKEVTLSFYSQLDEALVRFSDNGGSSWQPGESGTSLKEGTWTIYSDGTIKSGGPEGITYQFKIYYKGPSTHIHWSPSGTEEWTAVPGDKMVASEFEGYLTATCDLGMVDSATYVYNKNGDAWEKDGANDFTTLAGTWTYEDGTLTAGAPDGEVEEDYFFTVYAESTSSISIDYKVKDGEQSGNKSMSESEVDGYYKLTFTTHIDPTTVSLSNGVSNVSLTEGTYTIMSDGSKKTGKPQPKPEYSYTVYVESSTQAYITYDYSDSKKIENEQMTKSSGYTGYYEITVKSQLTNMSVSFSGGSTSNTTVSQGTTTVFEDGSKKTGTPPAQVEENEITIYYKGKFSAPYVLYGINGDMINVPGIKMESSDVSGYKSYTINLGKATILEAVFNNGDSEWESYFGNNFTFNYNNGAVQTFENGLILSGKPVTKELTVYYKGAFKYPYMEYAVNGSWTVVPGIKMASSEYNGYSKVIINIGNSSVIEARFSDGNGSFDSLEGQNYDLSYGSGIVTVKNGNVLGGKPSIKTKSLQVYYKKQNTTEYIYYRVLGQNDYVSEPGMKMDSSNYTGFVQKQLDIETDETGIEAAFNNGSSNWDTKYGLNYFLYSSQDGMDIYTVENSVARIGGPSEEDLIAPTLSATPGSGEYPKEVFVALTALDNEDADPKIYYTLNDTNPTTNSTEYTGSKIKITEDTTIKAIAVDKSGNISAVKSYDYVITEDDSVAPTVSISKKTGTYTSTISVTITASDNVDPSPEIYYTLDGNTPSSSSGKSTVVLEIKTTTTLKVLAKDKSGNTSGMEIEKYTINIVTDKEAPMVKANPNTGTYSELPEVKLTVTDNEDSNPQAYYTTDGSTPSTNSTKYVGTIAPKETEPNKMVLKVYAVDATGNSKIYTFVYEKNVTIYVERDNPVILQGFYWYIKDPVTEDGHYSEQPEPESNLWQYIAEEKAEDFYEDGFSHVWLPPTGKAFSPGTDYNVGYAIYDHYDLGEFNQMGRVRTKYGTKDQLESAIGALHTRKIKAIADIVMNHMLGTDNMEMMNFSQGYKTDIDTNVVEEVLGSGSVEAYLEFDFLNTADEGPRGTTHSDFVWKSEHFDGMENWGSYYLFEGKSLDTVNNFGDMPGDDLNYHLMRSDIILGADIDLQHTAVQNEMINWTKWLVDEVDFDGFRVDAIRHMHTPFVKQWANTMTDYMNSKGKGDKMYMFGENWDGWHTSLNEYLWDGNPARERSKVGIGGSMSLFDVPLHYDFQKIAGENKDPLDINTLPARGLVSLSGDKSVTFVDNHDTVPTEMLASYIPLHTKMQAYTFILLNDKGTPCVYYRDMYKGNFTGEHTNDNADYLYNGLKKLIEIREKNAYGSMQYYDSTPGILGAKRSGDSSHANSGLIYVIKQNGSGASSLNISTDGKTWVLAAGEGQQNGDSFQLTGDSKYAVWIPKVENQDNPPTLSANPAAGSYKEAQNVMLNATDDKDPNPKIYYTTDGSTPTEYSDQFSASIPVTDVNDSGIDLTIKALAVDSAGNKSDVKTFNYTIDANSKPGLTLHFKKPSGWGEPSVYFYETDPKVTEPEWGTAPKMEDEGEGWYVLTIADTTSASIIFKDGTNQLPAAQQPGYKRTQEGWFDGSSWSDDNPRKDTVAPTVTMNPAAGSYIETTKDVYISAKDNKDPNPVVLYSTDGSTPKN